MPTDHYDLNRTCVETYAAVTGEPVERVEVSASPQRALLPPEERSIHGPTVREAAAALLRQRLIPPVSPAVDFNTGLLRRFTAPDVVAQDLAAYEHEANKLREAALIEKRAHVALLRQQIESERHAAETRIHNTTAHLRAEKRRHQTRIRAIVTTGDDHPLETDLGQPSPYAAGHNQLDASTEHASEGRWAAGATMHERPSGLGHLDDDEDSGGDGGWDTQSSRRDEEVGVEDHDAIYEASLGHVEKRLRLNAEQRAILRTDPSDEQSNSGTSPNRDRADHATTKRLAGAVSRAEQALQAQRERVAELRNRLAANGISVADVASQGGGQKRSHSALSGSVNRPPPSVSPTLYPAHFVVGEAAKVQRAKWMASQTPGPSNVPLDKIKPLDPTVEKRLYRPPGPYQPPPPIQHDIKLRTASLHANKEPILGEVLPPTKVKKPEFTDETVKRMVDNETERRKRHLQEIKEGVRKHRQADIERTRAECGMAPLGADGEVRRSSPFADHVRHMYDEQFNRMRSAHQKLSDAQFERIQKQLFHEPKKLDKAEQCAMAKRLHDASMESIKQTMHNAVEQYHAGSKKVATHFAKKSDPEEIEASFKRLQGGK